MLAVLRFIGLVNAAIWFGAALFFTLAVGPAFFSPGMIKIFGGDTAPYSKAYAGLAAMVVMERYFLWLNICGAIAVIQGVAEAAYQGLPLKQPRILLAGSLLAVSLVGGFWLQPKMRAWQAAKYDPRATPAQREQAGKTFGAWHGVSQGANLLMTLALLVFFWRTAQARARDTLNTNPFVFRD